MTAADKIEAARALIEPLRATVLWQNANPNVMKAADLLAALADLADAQAQEIERLQRHRVQAEWYAEANGQRNAAEAERDRLRGCFKQIEEAALNGCLTPALVARITRSALGETP